MPPTQQFDCTVTWAGGPTPDLMDFSRDALIAFDGRPLIAASAAPAYMGSGDRVNPEELFVASLALCQMLSYLFLVAHRGVAIQKYTSTATGELAYRDGKMRMTQVTLRPTITIAPTADAALAHALVDRAHADCFISNSVSCAVNVEPTIVIGEE